MKYVRFLFVSSSSFDTIWFLFPLPRYTTKKCYCFAKMFGGVPSGDTFETFTISNFMYVHDRTLREHFNVWWLINNYNWSWKTFLETVLIQTRVSLSGAQTANYLYFLDCRLGLIYPKIEVKIEVRIGVKIKVTVFQFQP